MIKSPKKSLSIVTCFILTSLFATSSLQAQTTTAQEGTSEPAAAEGTTTDGSPTASPTTPSEEPEKKEGEDESKEETKRSVVVVEAAPRADEEDEVIMMEGIGGPSSEESVVVEAAPSASTMAVVEAAPSRENDLETPDVVITGTQLERTIEEAPVRTQLIKKEQLEQRKARNLYEALNYTTGVRVETNCQNCGFSQLRLNGLSGSYTQVLIDGMPSYSGLAGVYGLEQLPAELIERLEVVKGGGSSLYGPSAVAGVVNLITRKPKENYATAVTSVDLIHFKVPDIRITADSGFISQNGRVGGHIFASARRRGEVDFNKDDFSEMTRLRQLAAGANFSLSPVDKGELKLGFHVIREFRRGGDNIDRPAHASEISEQLDTDRWQAEARWSQEINKMFNYSLGYIFAYTGRKSYYGGGGHEGLPELTLGATVTQDDLDKLDAMNSALGAYGRTFNPMHIADAHVNINYDAWGPQVVTVGAQFTADSIDDKYTGLDKITKETATDFGVYLQHDWIFADWGESVIGARLDKHNALKSPIVSPRAALKIEPLEWLKLRTAFSMGFRAPQAFDEDLHVALVGGEAKLIKNDPNLKPERSITLSQQINTDFHLPQGNTLEAGINGYWTRLADAFTQNEEDDPGTPEIDIIRKNQGVTNVFGAELEVAFRSKLYAIRAGWTIESAKNSEPDGDIEEGTGQKVYRILRTPNNYGYLDAVFKYEGFQAQAGLNLTGPMLVPHTNPQGKIDKVTESPWFADLSMNVSYAFPTMGTLLVEPFLGMRNIFNSVQKDYDKGGERDSAYIYGPEQPRTLFLGVRGSM